MIIFSTPISTHAQDPCDNQIIDLNLDGCLGCFNFTEAYPGEAQNISWTLYNKYYSSCATSDQAVFCERMCFSDPYTIELTVDYGNGRKCTTTKTVYGCSSAGPCNPNSPPLEKPGVTVIYLEQCGPNGKFAVKVKPTCLPYKYEIAYNATPCNSTLGGWDTVVLEYPANDCAGLVFKEACVKATLPAGCCHSAFVGYKYYGEGQNDAICSMCTACSPVCVGPFQDVTDPNCSGGAPNPGGDIDKGEEGTLEINEGPINDPNSNPARLVKMELYDLSGKIVYSREVKASERNAGKLGNWKNAIPLNGLYIQRLIYSDQQVKVKTVLLP